MNSILLNDFSTLTLAGLLGVITYWVYNQANLFIFFDNTNTDEKSTLILMFGLANLSVYQILFNVTDLRKISVYLFGTVIAIVTVGILLFFIKIVSDKLRTTMLKHNYEYKFHGNMFKHFLDKKKSLYIYAYIFDFDNNLIEDGYIEDYSADETNNKHISLVLPDDYKFIKKENDELDTDFNNFEEVYLDFQNKIKIYIVRVS